MTRIDLQPSPLDRLDPVAQAIRWWTSQMMDILGRPRREAITAYALEAETRRLPRHVTICLSDADGFMAHAALPKAKVDTHKQALRLQLPDIAPLPPEELRVAARAVDIATNGVTIYAIAMARPDRLDQLEKLARSRGARSVVFQVADHAEPELLSPLTERKRQRSLFIDASIVVGIAAAAVVAVSAWTLRMTSEAEEFAIRERELRGAAVAAESARQQSSVSQAFVERGILKRRSMAALDNLAMFNTATPNEAWWTRIVWTPEEVAISAQGRNATTAIAHMSKEAKGWSIELSGSLAATGDTVQPFDVIARPRRSASP